MVRIITMITIIDLIFNDVNMHGLAPTQAHAFAPALAAPVAAIGALELAEITVSAAAAIGVISITQNQEYRREISALIEKVRTETGEVLKTALSEASILLRKISGRAASCGDPGSGASRNVGRFCTSSPEACCVDYFSKFRERMDKRRDGIRVFRNKRFNKLSCCLEWDSMHGGFEIFDERGNHLGERGCDDLSDDPCTYSENRGRHALPASSTHKPRSAACGR